MSLFALKYHVPSKGELGNNNIWRIYTDVDRISKAGDFNGMQGVGIEYVEHIEIEDCDSWTSEGLYRVGYSLLVEGEIEYYIDPVTNLKCARIYSGD